MCKQTAGTPTSGNATMDGILHLLQVQISIAAKVSAEAAEINLKKAAEAEVASAAAKAAEEQLLGLEAAMKRLKQACGLLPPDEEPYW